MAFVRNAYPGCEFGPYQAGLNEMDGNPLRGEFVVQTLSQPADGKLAGAIDGVRRRGQFADDAGDEYQSAPPSGQHRRQEGSRAIYHAVQICLQHFIIGRNIRCRERSILPKTGVVDPHIDTPTAIPHPIAQ